MKSKYRYFINYKILIIFIVVLFLSACQPLSQKPPLGKDIIVQKPHKPVEKIEKKKPPEKSVIDILMAEAKNFSLQKDFQDALFVYNQAFSMAGEDKKKMLIPGIESILSKASTKTIQEFINIKNIQIPRPLLLYWLGLNYAMETDRDDHVVKSREALETFLSQYPDHPYAQDAADLLAIIKKALFKRDTIGCLLPLTGKYAVFGQRALSGIQLAIQSLSKKYHKQFKVIIKDTHADTEKTIEGVRALYKQRVAGIIGPLLTVNQAGSEAQRLHMPLIALTQKSNFPLQGDYLFNNFITPEMQVQTLGDYLFSKLDIKKVAILYPDERYGKKYMELFWDVVDKYGGSIVGVEAYDGRKTDFTDPIQKLTGQFFPLPDFLKPEINDLKAVDPDNTDSMGSELKPGTRDYKEGETSEEKIKIDFEALFIPDSPSRINMILPQLAYNDATGMYLVGTNLWHQKSLLKEARGYNRHAIITDGFFADSRNPVTTKFIERFTALFHTKPEFLEAISYDTASILFLTAMDESIDSRKMLKDSLKGTHVFEGVTGNTVFDSDGKAHRKLFLMTIKKGKFVEISQ